MPADNTICREDYVRSVRSVGESLIKNAESIVGSEKYPASLSLHICFDLDTSLPVISVSRDFFPEKAVELKND